MDDGHKWYLDLQIASSIKSVRSDIEWLRDSLNKVESGLTVLEARKEETGSYHLDRFGGGFSENSTTWAAFHNDIGRLSGLLEALQVIAAEEARTK